MSKLKSDPEWLEVDLGQSYQVRMVVIEWEGGAWQVRSTEADAEEGGAPTAEELPPLATTFTRRHVFFSGVYTNKVRLYGTARTTPYGHSVFSFEVYADAMPPPMPP